MAHAPFLVDDIPVECEEAPGSTAELREAAARAFSAGTVMLPVGGGTKLHLGNLAPRGAVAIRTSGLRGIAEYEPDNMTVSVRAGTPLAEVQEVLAGQGQFIPLDPPDPKRATLGGLVSCNTSGPLRFRYGTMRDFLLGVRVVHADGTETKAGGKLVKNVTGYDMCKLYTGALGTLGIVAEATLKVMPLTEDATTVVLGCDTFGAALETAQSLLRADLLPEALEAWNGAAFSRTASGRAAAPWVLMIRLGDTSPAVRWQAGRALEIAAAGSRAVLLELGAQESRLFWQGAAGAREAPAGGQEARVKCSVVHRAAADVAQRMQEMADSLRARLEVYCHAGTYVLYGRYLWEDGAPASDALRAGLAVLRRRCAGSGGHMVVETVRPEVKAGFDVWGYDAPALEIMRRIKREFDPQALLNRGRFVGGI